MIGTASDEAEPAADRLLALLRDLDAHGPSTRRDLCARLGWTDALGRRYILVARHLGAIRTQRGDGPCLPARHRLTAGGWRRLSVAQ